MTIEIGGKERPVKMKMLAVKEYKKITGFNLAGGAHNFTDIIGSAGDKENGIEPKEFNPDLFIAFTYAVLVNGCYPSPVDFTLEDVSDWINVYDRTISGKLFNLYLEEMTGKSQEEIMEEVKKKMAEKQSPSPGMTSSEQPTVS